MYITAADIKSKLKENGIDLYKTCSFKPPPQKQPQCAPFNDLYDSEAKSGRFKLKNEKQANK